MKSLAKPRDPAGVILRLFEVIPEEEDGLRRRLDKIRHDSWFLTPEGKGQAWEQMRDALLERLGQERPADGWPMKVSEIMRGVSP